MTSCFAALVRGHRDQVGLTQEELAERAGLSVRAIRNLENGRTARPQWSTVRLLAAFRQALLPRRQCVRLDWRAAAAARSRARAVGRAAGRDSNELEQPGRGS